jgi:AdoMet-dependent heme synthase
MMMLRNKQLARNSYFATHALLKKPIMMAKGINFLAKRLLGFPTVRGMDIAITYNCNLRCSHCNITSVYDNNREMMTIDDIIGAINQIQQIGGFYVTFTGGEPLTKIDYLEEIISRLNPNSLLLQVQTNGTLLSESVCHRLKKMGIDNLHISFDTYHEADNWNDLFRVKRRQLEICRKAGLFVIFIALASHGMFQNRDYDRLISFSQEHGVPIGLNFAVPQGRWSDNEDILLKQEDSLCLRKISRENKYIFTDLDSNLFNYGCPAFSERFYINGHGDVQPCTFFQISFGNIKEEPLKDIWLRGLRHSLFSSFPDHCPPAENRKYIDLWEERRKNAQQIPIPHEEFFKI